MADGWETRPLSTEVAGLEAGVSVNAEDRPHAAHEIGVLKTSALNGGVFDPQQNKAVLPGERARVRTTPKADSIIVSRMNTPALVGESAYVGRDYPSLFLPDRLWQLRFRDDGSCNVRWLSYVLRSPRARGYISVNATGTSGSMKNLPKRRLLALPVSWPPLPEQRQIAEVLDTVDDAIRRTEQIIVKLKQVKQGLLHDLLTRGVDDNGELRDPDTHPEQFKDSPLGRIPKGWEVGGLRDVGSADRQAILTGPFGAQLGSEDFVDEGTPVLRIGNVQWGYLDLSDLRYVTPKKATALERFIIHEGDLLFARQGATTGRNALADHRAHGALINYHIIRVAFDRGKCVPTFMYAVFNSPIVQQQVDREKGRSTREGVSTKTLVSFSLPLPPLPEQQRMAVVLKAHDGTAGNEKAELEKLLLLKNGLMEDLLTGRVRVTPLLEAAAE